MYMPMLSFSGGKNNSESSSKNKSTSNVSKKSGICGIPETLGRILRFQLCYRVGL